MFAAEPDRELVELVLSKSSDATRRAVGEFTGFSAADMLLRIGLRSFGGLRARAADGQKAPVPEWRRRAIAALVASGAPVKPENQQHLADALAYVACVCWGDGGGVGAGGGGGGSARARLAPAPGGGGG